MTQRHAGRVDAHAARRVEVRPHIAPVAEEKDARARGWDAEVRTDRKEQRGQTFQVGRDAPGGAYACTAEDGEVRRLQPDPGMARRRERNGPGAIG
jgi:hypothetical protein